MPEEPIRPLSHDLWSAGLLVLALIVIAIVSLIRNWQRRRMYAYYQAPPHP